MTRRYRNAFSDADGIYLRLDERTGKIEERKHGTTIWRVGLTPAGQRLARKLGWK
jgi:hypothetical protein